MQNKLLSILFCLFTYYTIAQQQGEIKVSKIDSVNFEKNTKFDALSPAKAAFYSAVLPGLGQAYNKKYWKIPVIYAGIGTSLYFYDHNNKQYNRFRNAYKRRLAGFRDDEFINQSNNTEILSNDALIDAQKFHSKNKEVSILVAAVFYVLNIVDANVDAHLMNFNVDENLSVTPDLRQDNFNQKPKFALTLNYQF